MPPQSVALLACRHGLGAGGAFGAARAEVQNGLSPMSHTLLHEDIDRINLHALLTPAEDAIGGRVAPSDYADPKGLFDQWFQRVGLDIEAVLLGALAHAVQRAFNHFGNGGNIHARVDWKSGV